MSELTTLPDWLAMEMRPAGGEGQVFVRSASDGSAPTPVTGAERFGSGIDLYEWLPDGSGIVAFTQAPFTQVDWASQITPSHASDMSTTTSSGVCGM